MSKVGVIISLFVMFISRLVYYSGIGNISKLSSNWFSAGSCEYNLKNKQNDRRLKINSPEQICCHKGEEASCYQSVIWKGKVQSYAVLQDGIFTINPRGFVSW